MNPVMSWITAAAVILACYLLAVSLAENGRRHCVETYGSRYCDWSELRN